MQDVDSNQQERKFELTWADDEPEKIRRHRKYFFLVDQLKKVVSEWADSFLSYTTSLRCCFALFKSDLEK